MQEAHRLLLLLRPHLTWENFLALSQEARQRDGFRLTVALVNGEAVGIMGHRILADFVHGRHLYVDDLVVREELRGHGFGAAFLTYAQNEARRQGLAGLRLCTGVDNQQAIRFYEREGWALRAHAFKIKL